MKRVVTMAAIVILAASCSKENANSVFVNQEDSFIASFAPVSSPDGTKVSIAVIGFTGTASFEEGDAIGLFNSDKQIVQYVNSGEHTNQFDKSDAKAGPDKANEPLAVYPYYEYAKLRDDGGVSIILQKNQKVRNGLFPLGQSNGAPISVAKATADGNLTFHNACAILKFQVAEDMAAITIQETGSGDSRASIAGRLKINLDGTTVTTTFDSEENWEIKDLYITKDGGGNLTSGEVYYVAIAPCTMSNGIKFGLPYKEGYKDYKQSKWEVSKTFAANTIYDMGTISYDPN